MTKQDVLNEYNVVDGIIRSPGKFEAEMYYVPIFWDIALNGGADEDTQDETETPIFVFHLTPDDYAEFPELTGTTTLTLYESDEGFVYADEE